LSYYIFRTESAQQSWKRAFGFLKNKASLKSFRRRSQGSSVLKLEREENEKGLKAGRGGMRTEVAKFALQLMVGKNLVHFTLGEFENATISAHHFGCQGNHMILVTISFEKASFSKCSPST